MTRNIRDSSLSSDGQGLNSGLRATVNRTDSDLGISCSDSDIEDQVQDIQYGN